ncbi:hypothetical protein BCR44DRAFT_1443590 [Catenaria anguillulae PL171]|uniref:RRM domain-containing protein n=1 Tax=Catenaria anguillulae PL171 TaxID=765915 RepID=A0A1Y2HBB0_9FUNG|nr:hypothetical protein BCR44DRAFT_1443590 [Catenaria anguillulae PL171]
MSKQIQFIDRDADRNAMDLDLGNRTRRGRGFNSGRDPRESVEYETYDQSDVNTGRAQKSVQGYVIIATNIHPEASEEDVLDAFADFGPVSNIHLNLDRRSGFVKGYALVEYAQFAHAKKAVAQMNGTELLEQIISVDFAFSKSSVKGLDRVAAD